MFSIIKRSKSDETNHTKAPLEVLKIAISNDI